MKTKAALIKKTSKIIFSLCFVAYTCSYVGRMNYSACMSSMIEEGLLDKIFAGYLVTSFLILYGSGQLINGLIGNHVSPRIMVGIGFLGTALTNISMAIVPNKYALLIIWGLCGYFSSMFWAPIIRTFSEWLPAEKRYRAGLYVSLTIPAGTILSFSLSSLFLKISTWRIVFFASSIVLIIAFFVWVVGHILIRDYWENTKNSNKSLLEEHLKKNTSSKRIPLLKVILSTSLFAAMFTIIFAGSLKEPVINLMPLYLKEHFNTTSSFASFVAIILPIIGIPGAFVASFLYNKFFKNEISTCSFMFLISTFSLALAFFLNQRSIVLTTILIGCALSAVWGVNTMLLTFIPYRFSKIGKSSSISGLLNFFAQISSAVFSTVYAYTSISIGWNKTVLFWTCLAASGAFISIMFSKLWGKNGSLYEN